jgi:CheY-like chemotaxis protein
MATKRTPNQPAARRPLRVLVVDDNEDYCTTLHMLLERQGLVCHTIHRGDSVVAQVESFNPDVVLLDIEMPGMTGYEAAAALRKLGRDDLLLVAITALASLDARAAAHTAGFNHHFIKPVDPEVLSALLNTHAAKLQEQAPH